MEIKKKNRRGRTVKGGETTSSSGLSMPSNEGVSNTFIQRSVQEIDPVAAAALQENIDNAKSPDRKYTGNTGKKNSFRDTYKNKTAGVETQVLDTPNQGRGRRKDVGFRDLEGPGYDQRANKGSAYDRKLRSAVVKDQIARGVGDLNSGDKITANPTSKGRARLYKQIGGAAFEAVPDRVGDLMVEGRVTRDGGVINAKGQKVKMPDIKGLKKDLSQMAVKRMMARVGGAPLQALMIVDDMAKQTFGKGIFEHQHEEKLKASAEIESWGGIMGILGLSEHPGADHLPKKGG